MAKQTFIWTALPNGVRNGKLRLSAILTPRLTSTRTKPTLAEFPDLVDWPRTPVEFRVQFAKGPTLPARRVGPEPEPDLWRALFAAESYVRSYEADRGSSTVISYPVRNVLGFVEDRYRQIGINYPTRMPPASLMLDPDYFGAIRLEGSLTAQLKKVQAQTRKEQRALAAQAIAVMRMQQAVETTEQSRSETTEKDRGYAPWAGREQRDATEVPVTPVGEPGGPGEGGTRPAGEGSTIPERQDRVHQPITQPPDQSGGGSPLPPGLQEHIRGTIDENRQQVGGQISESWGSFAEDDPNAVLPDDKPTTRPGQQGAEELPEERPILFPIDMAPDPLRDFLRAGLFHLGLTPELSGDPDDREAQPMPMLPDFDFHEGISLLGDHPNLMRRLGLIIDLEVSLTDDLPDLSLCRLLPNWSPSADVATSNASPWTHYEINRSAETFMPRARPTNPDVHAGMLDLADRVAFGLIQTDPDSAAIKLLDAINSAGLDPEKPDKLAGLPALRSAGISLVRSGAGILLLQTFVTSTLHNEQLAANPDQIALYAEDLVQGYRPDVWSRESDRWYSLTGRLGTYEFVRTGRTEEIEDEGWVSLAATGGVSSAATDLHLHEMMFNWIGWSLVTPPLEPSIGDDGRPEQVPEHPLTSLQVRTHFAPPPGSLPTLRFGHTYRIRARTVDLAGNSLPYDPADGMDGASDEITYRRMEPVGSPVLIPLASDLPQGETVSRLVVRSYDSGTVVDGAQRHIAPPRSSLKMGEVHGVFDTPSGLDRDRYADAMDVDGDFAKFEPFNGPLSVPYCPDPLARYVFFKGLPGVAPGSVYAVDLQNDWKRWPYLSTIRITLRSPREGESAPKWNAESRELTVYIPRYEQGEVKVSCGFQAEADLNLMYLWDLMRDKASAELKQLALSGQHWMLTPAATINLVHAAQKPKDPPVFLKAMAHRKKGETSAMLSGQVKVHGKSTRAIQVYGSWEEPVDDENGGEPGTLACEGYAFEETVRGRDVLDVYHRQEFNDTRHRRVSYQAVASSLFREYFSDADVDTAADPDAFLKEGPLFAVDVLSTAPPAPLQVEYVIPTFGWEQPEKLAGQIVSLRKGGGLRVYLKRPWYSSGEGEMLGVVLSDQLHEGQVPESQRAYATHWGKDPLWQAGAPDLSPRIHHFRNAAASQRGLTVNGTKVAVVGCPVAYDKERKLWYADVELDVGEAYFPFIRLALARYQPKSVDGCHLSDVILTDFLQVVPDRGTSIARNPLKANELTVTVSGDTYDRGPVGPAVVEVTVESTMETGETLKWEPYPASTTTLKRCRNLWSGTVVLPEPSEGQRFRLIVSEYEQYMADDDKLTKRLVFADVLEV